MRTPTALATLLLFATLGPAHAESAASAPEPPASAAAPAGPETLAADAPRGTAAGTTFLAPAGWSLHRTGTMVVLDPPETDTHLVLVDVGAASDARAAVAAAWAAWRPQNPPKLKVLSSQPGRNGWAERAVVDYETSASERLAIQAVALRREQAWTVLLIDASEPTAEKRGGPIAQVSQSVRPAGYKRENFAGRTPHPLDAARVARIQDFVRSAMKELQVPGVGLALAQGDKTVYAGGLGVRELGKPAPVDARTLFMAASNTKGMSTLLVARLVDDGKLTWTEPVVDAYPAFRLGDAEVTKQVRIEHLVCACTGLPRQDFEWLFEFRHATPESSMALLGTMQPTSRFGEVFQYSNLMASAAGYIGGHLTYPDLPLGPAYDRAMQTRIFDPLGMRDTTFDYRRALRSDHASPHAVDADGHERVVDMAFNWSMAPHRPAGGVWTSSGDLIRYVELELAQGRLPDGKQLVSAENLLARRRAGVPAGEDETYGMGLFTNRSWGVPVVHHGGSMAGYKSDIVILPDAQVGAVLLTNSDEGQQMLRPFLRKLLEVVYDGEPEADADVAARARRIADARAEERTHLVLPAAAADVARLAPAYTSKELGTLDVRRHGANTVFDFGEWRSEVAARHNDDGTLSFVTASPGVDGFDFVVGERRLTLRDGQHEYRFDATQ